MEAILKAVLAMPLANLLILAGIVFLFVSVVGDISGKIAPGKNGRIAAGMVGAILLVAGLGVYLAIKPSQPGNTPGTQTGETPASTSAIRDFEYDTNRYGGDYRSFEVQH